MNQPCERACVFQTGANCSRLRFKTLVQKTRNMYSSHLSLSPTVFPQISPPACASAQAGTSSWLGNWVSNTIAQPQSSTALWHRPVRALGSLQSGGSNTSRFQVRSQHTRIFRLQVHGSRDRCFVLCLDGVLPMGPWLQVRALQCHTNTVKLNNKLAAIAIVISTCFDLLPRTHQPQTLVRVCDRVFQTATACKTPTVSSHMEKGEQVRRTVVCNRSHHPDPSGLAVFSSSCKKSLPTQVPSGA